MASIVLSLSATLVVISAFAVGTLLLVQSYSLISIKFADPFATYVTWLSYAVLAVVAWVLFKPRGKMPERILVIAGIYLILWLLTWHWGQDQVRQDAVQAILKRYPSAQDYTDKNFVMGLDKYPVYTAKTGAPVPLIVWRESGVAYGELGGDGSSVWYLWLFGLKVRLITTDRWIA